MTTSISPKVRRNLRAVIAEQIAKAPGDCWCWPSTNPSVRNHYGRVAGLDGRIIKAHRHVWALFNGPIPAGVMVLHRCDEPACVNPAHLYLGNHQDNMRDKAVRERAPNLKLTNAQVEELRQLRGQSMKHKDLAARFGISHAYSVRICQGHRRQHV